jgi:hypothetical protein
VNSEKHAARGGLSQTALEDFIGESLSVRQIGARTGFSTTAVKYWLAKYGLSTQAGVRRADGRRAKRDGRVAAEMHCGEHGLTEFWLEGRGAYRCLACRRERVAKRRRHVKEILVQEAGGACVLCGYDRCVSALHFHHLDPATKSFGLGAQGVTRSLEAMRAEAAKCVLVCANCHAEVGADLTTIEEGADKVVASG